MTLKFEIEVDLTDAILNNDSHPFEDFTTRDYEKKNKTPDLRKYLINKIYSLDYDQLKNVLNHLNSL